MKNVDIQKYTIILIYINIQNMDIQKYTKMWIYKNIQKYGYTKYTKIWISAHLVRDKNKKIQRRSRNDILFCFFDVSDNRIPVWDLIPCLLPVLFSFA